MKKKKKLKIRWGNVGLMCILIICFLIVANDIYVIFIQPWITGIEAGWTWFGLITFLLAFFIGGVILDYFMEDN